MLPSCCVHILCLPSYLSLRKCQLPDRIRFQSLGQFRIYSGYVRQSARKKAGMMVKCLIRSRALTQKLKTKLTLFTKKVLMIQYYWRCAYKRNAEIKKINRNLW